MSVEPVVSLLIEMRRIVALSLLLAVGCRAQIARFTGGTEGTLAVNAGMPFTEAQRRSTIKLNQCCDNDRYFDFIFVGEHLRFHGCTMYALLPLFQERITQFSVFMDKNTWPVVLHDARRTEALLMARGWKHWPGYRGAASLPFGAREAAERVSYSTAIDAFWYYKDDRGLTITVSGMPGGIPFYRRANGQKMFWESIGSWVLDDDDRQRLRR